MKKALYALRFRADTLWTDAKGQDLIEYALMAGFVATAAGAIMPNVATQLGTIFNKVDSTLYNAAYPTG